MKISNLEKQVLTLSLSLVSFPFFCFVFGSLGFLCGLSLTGWWGAGALALSEVWLWLRTRNLRTFSLQSGLFLLLLAGFMTLGALHTDNSWDARLYHKPAAILMAQGWNPVWEPDVTKFYAENGIDPGSLRTSHLEFFPKGQWVVSGITYLMTGNLDSGDYVNFLFLLALWAVTFAALREWLNLRPGSAFLASLAVTLNPIASACLVNGHIDGILGDTLLIFLLSCICFLKNGNRRWIPWILLSAVFGCSLKHTGPVYFGIAGVIYTLPFLWKTCRKASSESRDFPNGTLKRWLCIMFPIPLLVLILCANPFITNTVTHTSPFYPLHTFDAKNHPVEDILSGWYAIENFHSANPVQCFVYSFFFGTPYEGGLERKFPPVDISKVGSIDWKHPFIWFNAFGWIFGAALFLSLAMLVFVPRLEDAWILLALGATVLVQPHAWWARFIPQIWAFPILVFCILTARFQAIQWVRRRLRLLCGTLTFLLLIQGLLTFSYMESRSLLFLQLEQQFADLAQKHSGSVAAIGAYEKEDPNEIQVQPIYNFYECTLFADSSIPCVCSETKFGWKPIPGEPLAYFEGVMLYAPGEIKNRSYEDVALDKNDVKLNQTLSGIRWKLGERWKQLKKVW